MRLIPSRVARFSLGWLPSVCVLWLLVGACSSGADSRDELVRDSAGIRIVEHSRSILRKDADEASDSLRLAAEPLFEHGSGQGDYFFQSVASGALMPDGAVVLGDRRAKEVIVLDSTGALKNVIGGPGEGPRELGRVGDLVVLTDSTVVLEDDAQGRLVVIQEDSIIRSVRMEDPRLRISLDLLGVLDGSLIFSQATLKPGEGDQWFEGVLVRVDLDGAESDTVLQFDFFPPEVELPNTFPPGGVPAVAGDNLVVGRTDRGELKWYTKSGELKQIVRWEPELVPPTDSLWQAYAETMSGWGPASGRPPMPPDMLAERREALPNSLPLYSSVRGGHAGEVWVGEFTAGSEEVARWVVISAQGVPVGSAHMPRRFRILDIGEDRVLGVQRGDHDVESVAVYMIERIR